MKIRNIMMLIMFPTLSACVVIPQETVTLSQTLGNDLQVLHNSHRNVVVICYNKLRDDINVFVDDVYSPFVIHYVLKDELEKYQKGDTSLFSIIEAAAKNEGKAETENALKEMVDFQTAAHDQIEQKRSELLIPIENQESEILSAIDRAYENAIYANSTITGYLKSVRKIKETQQEALSLVGLSGADTLVTNTILNLDKLVNQAIKEGKEIDVRSDDAFDKLESVLNKLKRLINNN